VDDVANSGKTIMYALKAFLSQRPKKIQTVVLVERSHKLFPIQTDYSGLSIATTLQEHIAVETKDGEVEGAWLY
jgi:pyrimidine operon attenuation protein / uracil phosphoribosyltransferase